jgi:taurine--2-oxoglutarate transaminase
MEQILRLEGPENVAAVVVEPVSGSNGGLVPPGDYLPRLREICTRHGVLLIADEVIDGFGRTGEWFAVNHWGVVPDILVVAKGITSGYVPLGAAIVNEAIADYFEDSPLPLGCTYTGHPLACAAANATLAAYEEEGVIAHAKQMGEVLRQELRALQERQPLIGEMRGLGLLACLELVKDRATREPLVEWNTASPLPGRIKRSLWERGVSAYVRWNWLFIAPPLIITETELREGLGQIEEVLREVAGSTDT